MDLQIKKEKLTYRFVKNLMKICALFLLLSNNSVFADEVKSFTSQEEQNKCAKRFMVTSFPLQRGRFVIAGKITDEKNNLLQDVCVSVTKSISGIWKSQEVRNTYTLSNYFVIYLSECDSIYIELSKNGYIPVAAYYYYGYDTKLFHRTQKSNINITGNLITGSNLLFVMKKKGYLSELQTFNGIFLINGYDPGDVFLMNSWKKSMAKKVTGEPYLRVISKKNSGKSNVWVLELVNAKPEDGFIVVNFDENAVTYKNFWNLMGEAPRDGYSTKSFQILNQLGSRTFFYYFINGKYGKGHISREGRFVLFQNNEKTSDRMRSLWTK